MKRVLNDRFNFEPNIDSFVNPFQPRINPITSFGRTHTNKIDIRNPIGLTIHPINGLIFIAENRSPLIAAPAIHVFTPQGDYVTSFGNGYIASPCKISLTVEPYGFYILDELRQGLTQFTDFAIRTLCPIDSSLPRGLVCDEDGFLYIMDGYRRRVCVYNSILQLERDFYLKIAAFPIDLGLLTDILVILCNPTFILYCSIQGEKLRYTPRIRDYVIKSIHFCVDPETNWTFISDCAHNSVQIFNMEGELVRSVLPMARNFFPSFLAITPHRTLVVVDSHCGTNPIQIFAL